MNTTPNRLLEVAEQLNNNKEPDATTVRSFIGWFGVKGRGRNKVQEIRETLAALGIDTRPDFDAVNIDSPIHFVRLTQDGNNGDSEGAQFLSSDTSSGIDGSSTPQVAFVGGAIADPTHRISRLASADRVPISVKPDSTLQEAVHLMMLHDFSQLPVMQGEREVKGVVSWYSVGFRKLAGQSSNVVRDYMEQHQEIRDDASLFDAIPLIVKQQYVLVRDAQNKISGIVTTSDLSEQFGQLSEPFLLVGEIENHIRSLIIGKFTAEELAANRDPSDEERAVERVDELTLGEYKRLLENPKHWKKLGLIAMDRRGFIEQLENVRQIRNRVMHFEPDGLELPSIGEYRMRQAMVRKLSYHAENCQV